MFAVRRSNETNGCANGDQSLAVATIDELDTNDGIAAEVGERCRYRHDCADIHYEGPWQVVPLHKAMTGRMASGGDESSLSLRFEGGGVVLHFWSHAWSGQAFVEIDGVVRSINLYSATPGLKLLHIDGLTPSGHSLRIYGSRTRDPRSASNQVIFYQAVSHQHSDGGSQKVSAEPRQVRPTRFGTIYTAPVLMTFSERVVLYGTIFGLRPRRSLEIGTNKGGSSMIIVAALDDLGGDSHLVCVDPTPLVAPEHWQQICHRTTLLAGGSPEILPQAVQAAGGHFDFALIDGDHELPGVIRDIEGVLPILGPCAHLLFHDAHFVQVRQAIDQMLQKHSRQLTDCGLMSVEQTPDSHGNTWGGLRLLRYAR
jgi:predicted O-methyltransferase YrrM